MDILALDLGKNLGVATNRAGIWKAGTIRLDGETRGTRAVSLVDYLDDATFLQAEGLLVAYERPFTRGLDATRSLWGMAGMVEWWAAENGLPCVDIVPSQVKKWATGKGTAKKPDMMAAAARLGFPNVDEHAADALLLGLFVVANKEKN